MRAPGKASSYYGRLKLREQPPAVGLIWHTRDDELEPCEPFGMSSDYESCDAEDDSIDLMRRAIDDTCLTPVEGQVLHMRYYLDMTLRECGERLGVCAERIRQREAKLLRRLKRNFERLQRKP